MAISFGNTDRQHRPAGRPGRAAVAISFGYTGRQHRPGGKPNPAAVARSFGNTGRQHRPAGPLTGLQELDLTGNPVPAAEARKLSFPFAQPNGKRPTSP